MKKLFLILVLSFSSFLFAINFLPYKDLDLGITEDKLIEVMETNHISYKYIEESNYYDILIPDDYKGGFDCNHLTVHLNKKQKVFQIELIFDSDKDYSHFAKSFKNSLNHFGIKDIKNLSKNKYKHDNSYAYWRKMFYVIEEYFNPGLCISVIDVRYTD